MVPFAFRRRRISKTGYGGIRNRAGRSVGPSGPNGSLPPGRASFESGSGRSAGSMLWRPRLPLRLSWPQHSRCGWVAVGKRSSHPHMIQKPEASPVIGWSIQIKTTLPWHGTMARQLRRRRRSTYKQGVRRKVVVRVKEILAMRLSKPLRCDSGDIPFRLRPPRRRGKRASIPPRCCGIRRRWEKRRRGVRRRQIGCLCGC